MKQHELDFETKHLTHIVSIAKEQRSAIQMESGKHQADLIDAQKERWENSSHVI